jgi:serine/threonine protein kinase
MGMSIESDPKHCPKCGTAIPAEAPQGLCPRCLMQQASLATETGQGAHTKSAPPTREEVAAAFPQLEILELIGQGGMGFVFKAQQPKLDRFVALKILPQSLAADPAFAERFTREGRMLARLNHPNIVTVHDFGQANGFFYLLMEFVDGVNLRQAMKVGRFTPAQALAVVPQICDALQCAHDQGIVHRDIKPENILLGRRGRVKVADFGLAKILGSAGVEACLGSGGLAGSATATAVGKIMGTPQYMAPEQIQTPGQADHRVDIYALGVVFYEMLTGQLPDRSIAPPSRIVQVDVRLDEVVLRALEDKPEMRYLQASALKTRVETITAEGPGLSTGRSGFWTSRRSLCLGSLWVGCALAIFLGAMLVARTTRSPLTFGPTMERVLPFNTKGATDALCLESNQVSRSPYTVRLSPFLTFQEDQESNVVYLVGSSGVFVLPLISESWDSISANRIARKLASGDGQSMIAVMKSLPAAYAFKTRHGTAGVLNVAASTSVADALDVNWRFIAENSTNVVLFPPKNLPEASSLRTFKPIPSEAVRLFHEQRELISSMLFDKPLTGVGSIRLSLQVGELSRRLAPLVKQTAFEAASLQHALASERWEKLDPNKDRKEWDEADRQLKITQFTEERLMVDAGAGELVHPGAGNLRFGPWVDVTLLHPSAGRNCCVSLDTAEVLTPPGELITAMRVTNQPGKDFFEAMQEFFFWGRYRATSKSTNALAKWIEDTKVDAVPLGAYGLAVFCPIRTSVEADATGEDAAWEGRVTPAWLLWKLHFIEERPALPLGPNSVAVLTLPVGRSTATNQLCIFRTRSGTPGVLQITGFTTDPVGVRIRYKMVQNAASRPEDN